jgi:glycosyltransferase involved in cell wall biosynthesis
MTAYPVKIYIALPAMNELENMEHFIQCCKTQTYQNFKLVICINQPDDWWEKENKVAVCQDNALSLEYLKTIKDIQIEIIDRSSKGHGWKGKEFGVGWARKTVMDQINKQAEANDIVVSLDADTRFNFGYLDSITDNFKNHPDAVALSVPYYHDLTGDEQKDRAILRYEIYMRYYVINLWRIGSPYSFTAIGSAMALPVWAYRAIGGMTPHKSGEDFYFLQKLRKFGNVLTWNKEKVYPAARYSDRVFFGTGPAMIKGRDGDWSSYPIYPFELFDEIKATYDLFSVLFEHDATTPMDDFIEEKFGNQYIWQPLRENFKTKEQFVKACHHKIDGLRILQFLKWRNAKNEKTDEENLSRCFQQFYPKETSGLKFDLSKFSLSANPVRDLDLLRNILCEIEEKLQISNDHAPKS